MRYLLRKTLIGLLFTVFSLSGCAGAQSDSSAKAPMLSEIETIQDVEVTSDSLLHNVDSPNTQQGNAALPDTDSKTEETMAEKMILQIGDSTFTATLENNAAVDDFVEMMNDAPVIIQMNDYSGFEKVGSLGADLPADDSRTTTHAGDVVLYNGNQIVIFYGSNSWSYTRIGKIDDLSGWEDALGNGDVTVTFSLE